MLECFFYLYNNDIATHVKYSDDIATVTGNNQYLLVPLKVGYISLKNKLKKYQ